MSRMKVVCPNEDCQFPRRTYADVWVGQSVDCSWCRQTFQVTYIAEQLPDDAPLPVMDGEGVPLSVPTAEVEAYKAANWPGYAEEKRRNAVQQAAEDNIEVFSSQGVRPEYRLRAAQFLQALNDAGWDVVRR